MKLRAPISHSSRDDGKRDEEAQASRVSLSTAGIVVGYALTSKKKKSFLQPKFVNLARNKGIEFVPIDETRPLTQQGLFNIILHKLAGKEWSEVIENLALSIESHDQIVEDYKRVHPEVIVLDPPDAIQHLRNRQSMLEVVADLNLPDCYGKVCIPRQLVISADPTSIRDEVIKAGLRLPLVVKPLVVDGSAKSHELFLAYDQSSLSEVEAPVVLQEFVNHGGILFKVFIVGESIRVVRRLSLPDVTKQDLSKISGVLPFPRVSCAAASKDHDDMDSSVAELPPQPLLEVLARQLQHRLGLRLFNVDVIRESETEDVYYIIDINYFPGYGKMPEYEHAFTDFLVNLMQSKQ